MKYYFVEVPVAGRNKSTSPPSSILAEGYPQYLNSICRNGNAVSFIRGFLEITLDNFFLPKNLELNTRYIFWTFDDWFVADLKNKIYKLPGNEVDNCINILSQHFTPYDDRETLVTEDSEIAFCYRKKYVMQQKVQYAKLFSIDRQNRELIRETLLNRQVQLSGQEHDAENNTAGHINTEEQQGYEFVDFIKPVKGSAEVTYKFMKEFFLPLVDAQISGSVRVKNIFSSIAPDGNDANPRGVNGTIMAFIDFFDNHEYFERTHNGKQVLYRDILVSFLAFTKNKIGNMDTIVGKREADIYYNLMLSKFKNRSRSLRL